MAKERWREEIRQDCVFCKRIVNGQFFWEDDYTVAFGPLNPVVKGHTLVVPKRHVRDFAWAATTSAQTMFAASQLANNWGGEWNLITSKGASATQTIMHLHIHLVPREENDGLHLPWTGQNAT